MEIDSEYIRVRLVTLINGIIADADVPFGSHSITTSYSEKETLVGLDVDVRADGDMSDTAPVLSFDVDYIAQLLRLPPIERGKVVFAAINFWLTSLRAHVIG